MKDRNEINDEIAAREVVQRYRDLQARYTERFAALVLVAVLFGVLGLVFDLPLMFLACLTFAGYGLVISSHGPRAR